MPVPSILVVAPPALGTPKGVIAPKFTGAEKTSVGLAAAIGAMAREKGCAFLDSGTVTRSSVVDGVHPAFAQHRDLALVLLGRRAGVVEAALVGLRPVRERLAVGGVDEAVLEPAIAEGLRRGRVDGEGAEVTRHVGQPTQRS